MHPPTLITVDIPMQSSALRVSLFCQELLLFVILGTVLSTAPAGGAFAVDAPKAEPWVFDPMQWSRGDKDASLHTGGRQSPFAILQSAPISKCVTVESDVVLSKAVGDSWKVCGVAVMQDIANFWHFALVLPPDSQKPMFMCELCEMRNGQWLAQGNLKLTVNESKSEPWRLGERYRLRLAMDSEGIEGSLADAQGRVLERKRYAFSGEAVTSGRPVLHCNGFEATFSRISSTHSNAEKAAMPTIAPYRCDSYVQEISGKKTGYFHVERQGDIWWTVDPLGRGFVPLGVDHTTFGGHWCEKLAYAPYGKKNAAKYSKPEVWEEETLGRLHDWGFNLLGAGCASSLQHRGMAHTVFLAFGSALAGQGDEMNIIADRGVPGSAFPNVFHPKFEEYCRFCAWQACTPHINDPWLFGYFLDNELAWWGEAWGNLDTGLFDVVMRKSATHSAKRALRDFLAQRYGNDIGRFNQAWGSKIESFDRILESNSLTGLETKTVTADKKAFAGLIGERYFGAITRAIREVDPNHMILGCRFAGGYAPESVWEAAGHHCDIVTFNYYGNVDLTRGIARDDRHCRRGKLLSEVFLDFYKAGQRPMMVTEWSFPALDAGLPSIHGAGQRFRTQAERTRATEITARTMLAMPFILGYDYFMWVDEPELGISEKFPEDSNYGLVNEENKPYELLTTMFTNVHRDAARLRREGLAKAGVATSESAPSPSRLAQFLAKTSAQAAGSPEPGSALHFERKGEDYLASNGVWEIRGRVGAGSLTTDIRHRGLPMGRFNGVVQEFVEQNQWVSVERLADVQAVVGRKAMTLDLIGRFVGPQQDARQSFEIAYRLTLQPNCDWFTVELLWCRNLSDRPLDMRAIYFYLTSQIGGSTADDAPIGPEAVPQLWGTVAGDAWLDRQAKAFWGFAVDDVDDVQVRFWLDDQKGQHPDARLEIEQKLGPNETFRPKSPVGVICLAGRGDRNQWEAQARKTLDSLDTP